MTDISARFVPEYLVLIGVFLFGLIGSLAVIVLDAKGGNHGSHKGKK